MYSIVTLLNGLNIGDKALNTIIQLFSTISLILAWFPPLPHTGNERKRSGANVYLYNETKITFFLITEVESMFRISLYVSYIRNN